MNFLRILVCKPEKTCLPVDYKICAVVRNISGKRYKCFSHYLQQFLVLLDVWVLVTVILILCGVCQFFWKKVHVVIRKSYLSLSIKERLFSVNLTHSKTSIKFCLHYFSGVQKISALVCSFFKGIWITVSSKGSTLT